MSVSEDLARNRRVFERLTGAFAEQADSAADGAARRPRSVPAWERAESAQEFLPAESSNERRFSLAYGVKTETGPAFHFNAPDSGGFPALRETAVAPLQDPLENLYHQLEVEARRTSQLSGEEEL